MAYINSKTFDIIHSGDPLSNRNDWYFVDDILADTIQVLNARGYTTRSSSAGVPYCEAKATMLRNVRDDTGVLPKIEDIAKAFRARVPDANLLRIDRVNLRDFKVTCRVYTPQATRIEFESDVYFRKLPSGTKYADRVLSHEYDPSLTGFDFLAAQYEFCRELFDWSCALPLNLFIKKC